MNYWIITLEYPPVFGGGIGTYCYHTAQMLKQKGWQVTIFIYNRSLQAKKVNDIDGIRVIEFPISNQISPVSLGYDTNISYGFSLIIKEYLNKEGVPSILESQEYAGISYYILQWKHLGHDLFEKLKVIITIHAPSFLYHDYNHVPSHALPYFWIGEMERWCIKAADQVNAPGQFIINAIKSYFSASLLREIPVVPYPFQSLAFPIDFTADPRKDWFFFGKLTRQKGIFSLLKTYRILWEKGWSKQLKIIGGGDHFYHPENQSVISFIKKKYKKEIKKSRLVLLGKQSPYNWNRLTASGCVVIIPSIGDNYPFTIIESLTNGQIVLASVQGGQRELIQHGENGFLFDHEVYGDLENKIKEIEALPIEKIQQIRRNAVTSVTAKHNYKSVYEKKRRLLDKILEERTVTNEFPFTNEISLKHYNINEDNLQKGLLSIIIPYYNMGMYIEDTLLSIFNCRYPDKEIIIVDDGSSDRESIVKLKELQLKYPVKVISLENQGLAIARNIGAKNANGEFLAFVDADDKVHPEYYTKCITILRQKRNIYFTGSWIQYFEKSNSIWPAFQPEPPYILYYNMVCSGALVYKTTAFLYNGWNDKKLEYGLEDWDSVISLVKNGWRGVIIPEPLYYYRVRKNSMARRFTREKLLFSTSYISKKHADIYSKFASDLANLYNANGPGFKIDNPSLDYNNYGLPSLISPFAKKIIRAVKKVPILKKIGFKIYVIIKK